MTELAGYVLHDRVGTGAVSEVWRAEAVGAPGRLLAVKRLAVSADRQAVQDLRREADALGRLSHPSILGVVDVVPDGEGLALVVPYAPGGSLADRLAARDGGLPAVEVADLGARLAGALAAAHGAGLVHRDVKPANVLFDGEGQPLLSDFGTARLTGEPVPVAGTAEYLDPATVAGRPADARSDVYGLAVTLYEALAGTPPFAGSTPRQTLAAADRGVHVTLSTLADAPEPLVAAIERGLDRDPDARFATAADFAGRLDEARRRLEVGAGPPPVPGPPRAVTPGPAGPPADPSSAGTAASSSEAPSDVSPVDRGRTRQFGPAPPRPEGPAQGARHLDRRLVVAALVLVAVVPVALVLWLARSDGPGELTGDDDPGPADAGAADDAPGTDTDAAPGDDAPGDDAPGDDGPTGDGGPPGPPCDDVEPPEVDDGTALLPADVDGRGCTVPVAWDGHQLAVPSADGTVTRYDLDADADDVLLFGDWNCDGRDAPALYRPGTGQLFSFDDLTEDVTVRGEPTGVVDGEPRVVADTDGCDRVEVAPG